ncbi:MAG: diaminopimelate decarboxylase [Alphaproteobacteria bacterium]|nr:diaminopimelate decarboxylase [Alphaproteobacteria bacterium]
MNHFEYKDGALHCEGVALEAIAAAVGTPVYVYSTATLERHVQVMREAFAPTPVLIAFAVKANANIAVLATLAAQGAGADTVSAGEIMRALNAGVPPSRIIFSGVGKTDEELDYALAQGIHQINVESAHELTRLGEIAARRNVEAPVAIRVNPAIGAGGHQKISTGGADAKFGVSAADALALYAAAQAHPHLDPKGLAVHIGSQIRDLEPLRAAFQTLRTLTETLRAQGLPLTRLDLGGGLGVPYFNEPDPPAPAAYAAMAKETLGGLNVDLAIEPGRLIAANAGVLLTRVIRIQARADRRILVLDAGMSDLLRPAMYDAFHDLRPVRPSSQPPAPFDLVGPICETGDTFARARLLAPPQPGDLCAFMTAGAYGAVMASTYNARPLVPETLVRGDRYWVVRRRLSVAEQIALESLPTP